MEATSPYVKEITARVGVRKGEPWDGRNQTYPEESIQDSEHGESLKSRGITFSSWTEVVKAELHFLLGLK